jgi:hypothetical protein
MHATGFCRKIRFLGKIQKSGVRNSMTYRLPNSRKSNFATEPFASFDFHPTLTGMLGVSLVGYQVVQMCQPSQKRLLAPCGDDERFSS